MKVQSVAVLDIGTSKITCMIAETVANGEFVVRASGVCNYNGYDKEGFFEPDTIADTVGRAVKIATNSYGKSIKSIVVGAPASFCYMGNSEASVVFRTKKKIDLYDIKEIFVKADIFGDIEGKLVSSTALYYQLDDDSRMIFNPVNMVASRIMGVVSFCYMHKQFEKIITASLAKCGIRKVRYVSGAEVQAKYVAQKYNRHYHSIVIDIGHINTSVMLASGKGVLLAKSFDLGSGYIAGDLIQVLHTGYNSSVELLGKIDLSLDFTDEDNYSVGDVTVPAVKTNDVAKARIEQIARFIAKCFSSYNREVPASTPIVLTGGGLAYMRGAVGYLSYCLNKEVVLYTNDNPQLDYNEYNSVYAIISNELTAMPTTNGAVFSRRRG